MIPDLPDTGWVLLISPKAIQEAIEAIEREYPAEPERRDLMERLRRMVASLQKRPFQVWEYPPRKTRDPDNYRLPADPQALISAYGDIIVSKKTVAIIAFHIRPSRHAT